MYSSSVAQTAHMYSGAKTGLVTDVQREYQELKKQDQDTTDLGGERAGVTFCSFSSLFVKCGLSYLLSQTSLLLCLWSAFVQYLTSVVQALLSFPKVWKNVRMLVGATMVCSILPAKDPRQLVSSARMWCLVCIFNMLFFLLSSVWIHWNCIPRKVWSEEEFETGALGTKEKSRERLRARWAICPVGKRVRASLNTKLDCRTRASHCLAFVGADTGWASGAESLKMVGSSHQ